MINFFKSEPLFRKSIIINIILIFFSIIFETLGLSLILPLMENLLDSNENTKYKLNFIFSNDIIKKFIDYFGIFSFIIYTLILCFLLKFLLVITKNFFLYYFEWTVRKYWIDNITKNYVYSKNLNENNEFKGKIISELTNETLKASSTLRQKLEFFSQLTLVIFLIILLLITNFIATIMSLSFFLLILVFLQLFILRKAKSMGKSRQIIEEDLYEIITEVINGLSTIQFLNKQNFLLKKISNKTKEIVNLMKKIEFITRLPMPLTELLLVIFVGSSLLLIINVQGYEFIDILPTLSLFSIVLFRIATYGGALSSSYVAIRTLEPSLDKILKLSKKINIETNNNKILNYKNVSIELINLNFNYGKSNNIFKTNLNYNFKSNEITYIFGESGKGKTTILKLIMDILQPSIGEITYKNNDGLINNNNNNKYIGYVDQDPFFFNDTIKNNIILEDNPSIDQNFFDECLKISLCNNFISNKKEKENTNMGNRGDNFSGGQKARIALARALYQKPSVLILDEIFSSIDRENALKLLKNLKVLTSKMTIIIVSHQLIDQDEKQNLLNLNNL